MSGAVTAAPRQVEDSADGVPDLFGKLSDQCAPPIAGLLALALYAATLAPGLTWAHDGADGGDLLAAALTGGVPHPPGYPVHQLLLRAGLLIWPGEPARMGNWLSALCAAGAVALLASLACRALPASRWRGPIALAVALAWAASPALWSQAVITEVYTLNALFATLLLWLLWRWREARSGSGWLAAGAFVAGLGLGNHLSLALMLPAAAVWLWAGRTRGPSTRLPTAAAAGEGGGATAKVLLLAVLAFLAGLSVYIYLPLAARGDPPVNWGDPRTPAGLWWLVSGQVYRPLVLGVEARYLPGRLAAWVGEAMRQFGGPWWVAVGLVGLWRVEVRDRAGWWLTVLAVLAFSAFAIGYDSADSYLYLIPAWAVLALWIGAGLAFVAGALERAAGQARTVLRIAAFAALLLLPGVSVMRFWPQMDLSRERLSPPGRAAQDFVEAVSAEAAPGAVILTAGDGPTFALWYAIYGLGRRPDLAPVNVNLLGFSWYRETLARYHPSLGQALGDARPPEGEWDPSFTGRFLAELAARMPVYRAERLDLESPGVVEEPVGTLTRWRGK